MEQISERTRKMTLMGILLAIAIVLSMLEHSIPQVPGLPPNTKLGLSNIIVMYTMFFIGTKYAYAMTVLKSVFVMMMRGTIAGLISVSGGLLSVTVMAVLLLIFGERISYIMLSVAGSLGHNVGQLTAASLQMQYNLLKLYWPIILIFGVIFGIVTGVVLRVVIPVLNKATKLDIAQRKK